MSASVAASAGELIVEGDVIAGEVIGDDMPAPAGVVIPVLAGEGFTTVVLCSVVVVVALGDAAGATVSVRCSHAARSDALASIQMYFFIFMDGVTRGRVKPESKPATRSALPAKPIFAKAAFAPNRCTPTDAVSYQGS